MGGSARCSCVSCYSSSSLSCPIGCSARFCSAACFATHQASCPFVTFAKPVMITFHESLNGASTGWAVAQQGVLVLFNPCSVMFQRSFSATGCFTAGSLHPLARSPTVEFWASLRPWFEYFQHTELNLSGSRAALGRSRAQVRDAGRVLSGLVSRFRQALLDGSFWLALLPKRGTFWGSQGLPKAPKWNTVFQSPVLGLTCSGFISVKHVLLHNCPELHLALSGLPCGPASLSEAELSPGFFLSETTLLMARSKMCVELLRAKAKQVLPPQPSLWDSRLTSQLDASTLCLQRHRAQAGVIPAMKALLRDMASSTVLEHFKTFLLWADHRGSDVQHRTGLVPDGSAKVAPHPAFAWRCHWRAEQHINELTTLLNYLRMPTGSGALQDVRLFHIFYSQVAAAAAAKERSFSRVLNRVSPSCCRFFVKQCHCNFSLDSVRMAAQ